MRRGLIVGRGKHGKTSSLYFYAKRQIEKEGKKIFVVNTDGGSDGFWESTDIAKHVRVVYPMEFETKLAIMRYASMGMVPTDKTGRRVTKLNMDKYSDIFWEGLTASADMMMAHLANHEDLQGVKHALAPAGTFMDGEERYSVNSMSHYNLVHKELKKMLAEGFFRLPCNVFITALLDEGEDEYKANVMGPATVGKAITHKIPQWVPDLFHQEKYLVKGETKFRLWFEEHIDKGNQVPVLCGVRMMPKMKKKLKELYPKGWIPVDEEEGTGLHSFYEFRENLNNLEGMKENA